MPLERIQKILSAAGYGSRRDCEQMVLDGRIRVNRRLIDTLPLLVDPDIDRIAVDGKLVQKPRVLYLLMNKPSGIACHVTAEAGQRTLADLLRRVKEPVAAVGRTEAECAGLVLLTNDRDMAAALSDSRRGIEKTYRVEARGMADGATLGMLRQGIRLSDGRAAPAKVCIIHKDQTKTILEIVTNDHLRREIPRVLAKAGLKMRRMTRIGMGRLTIRKLPLGAIRSLTPDEIAYLKQAAEGMTTRIAGVPSPRHKKPRFEGSHKEDAQRLRRPASSPQRRAFKPRRSDEAPRPAAPLENKSGGALRAGKKRRIVLPDD